MDSRSLYWCLSVCVYSALGSGCDSVGAATRTGGNGSGGASTGGTNAGGRSTGGTAIGGTGASVATSGGASPTGGALSLGGSATGGTELGGMGGESTTGGRDGTGGGATPEVCSFEMNEALSPEIPTVGIADWATDLEGLTSARIEFSLDEPNDGELNLGSGGPISVSDGRALLLGLKPGRSYTYRIVANVGQTVCVSPSRSLVTGTPTNGRVVTRTPGPAISSRTNGFVIVSHYKDTGATILDMDGDIVWSVPGPKQSSRALMDWEGKYMWMMAANAATAGAPSNGKVTRVLMDGSGAEQLPGLELSHHDFAVLPGGVSAFLLGDDTKGDSASNLVERSADGVFRTLARLDADTLMKASSPGVPLDFHANALRYYAADDSYSVSDLYLSGISKINRQGVVEWQLRNSCDSAPLAQCATGKTEGAHGHQLLESGNLLFSVAQNGAGAAGFPVYEYSFSLVAGALQAKLEWTYDPAPDSFVLGDVQRLENGNTLVTYTESATLHEVSLAGELVQSLTFAGGNQLGYSAFRTTLYGPPQ